MLQRFAPRNDDMMTKLKAVTKFKFCSGHRLMNHENKCANLHGHNYAVFIHAESENNTVDDAGRVVDFSVLKDKVGTWILNNWDHTMILYKGDATAIAAAKTCEKNKVVFEMDAHPTAENMAKHLLEEVCPKVLAGTGAVVNKIVLWETEDSYGEASFDQGPNEI